MGDKTSIEWCDATWNAFVGCSKVSEGCDNCYAIGVAHRGMSLHHKGLTIRAVNEDTGVTTTEWNGEIHRAPDSVFFKPLKWKRPRRIFVNSLSDLFHPSVSESMIVEVFRVMQAAPQHTFQILTKRPQRMSKLLNSPAFWFWVMEGVEGVIPTFLPNVWLGVSIESNRYAWRARFLRGTPAAVRWVSAEPLIGSLDQLDLTGIDWVVAGGESGPGSRPMHPKWVRNLRDRCADDQYRTVPVTDYGDAPDGAVIDWERERWERSGSDWIVTRTVPFLFKQAGTALAKEWGMSDKKGGKLDELPAEFRIREYPTS